MKKRMINPADKYYLSKIAIFLKIGTQNKGTEFPCKINTYAVSGFKLLIY